MRNSSQFKRLIGFCPLTVIIAALALFLRASPARAVDEVEFQGNDVFQLDGADSATANADTCVGTENGCPSEENPVWPADWDPLLYPSLTSGAVSIVPGSGAPPNAYSFNLPWGGFGSFSGIFTSTLVSTGLSTILKQGSKNSNDISTWVVASQSSPPKDAYLAAALASYTAPATAGHVTQGDELLYFGSTRFSPNGSATVGIWLFQQNVVVCQSGPSAGKALCVGGTSTVAQHVVGDLFLFLTFSGSGIATIQAATWQGANGPAGFLGPAPATLFSCPTAGDDICAVTNEVSAITLGSPTGPQAPGNGFNVSGPGFTGFPGGMVPALQFQEGGLDLNSVLGGVAPCFSSVLFASVTSGSSPNTASMKSILLGTFNTCAINATKACGTPTVDVTNNSLTYPITGTVDNTGGGAVSGLTLTDTFAGSPQSFDSGSLTCTCGASACTITGSNCSTTHLNPGGIVNYAATITTNTNGGSDVVTAVMGGVGGGSATAQSNTATCPSQKFSDTVSISKNCTPGASLVALNGLVAVQVGVEGVVTNGSSQLSLSSVKVYDCVNGTFGMGTGECPTVSPNSCTGTLRTLSSLGSIAPSGTAPWSDTYNPSVAPTCGPYNFSDQVLVDAQCTSQFCTCPEPQNVANQTCPLCPGPTCP
jgi:hypothetical protein